MLLRSARKSRKIVRKATRVGDAKILAGRRERRVAADIKNEFFSAEVRQEGNSIWGVLRRWERRIKVNKGANDWNSVRGLRLVITLYASQPRKDSGLVSEVVQPSWSLLGVIDTSLRRLVQFYSLPGFTIQIKNPPGLYGDSKQPRRIFNLARKA